MSQLENSNMEIKPEKLSVPQLEAAIREHHGKLPLVAKALDCGITTIYNYANRHESVQAAITDARNNAPKKLKRSEKLSVAKIEAAIRERKGELPLVAQDLGCGLSTLYTHIRRHESIRETVADAKNNAPRKFVRRQGKTQPEKLSVPQLESTIWERKGKIALVAQDLGCGINTIYNYAKRYESVQATITDAQNSWDCKLVDLAETKLCEAVEAGVPWAVKYTLDNKGRDRGYGSDNIQIIDTKIEVTVA